MPEMSSYVQDFTLIQASKQMHNHIMNAQTDIHTNLINL